MATPILADETAATIADFQAASRELANVLGLLRDHHAPTDRQLAGSFDELRSTFDVFAAVAVRDAVALRTLSRVYEDLARTICRIADDDLADVRRDLATARGLTYLCANLVTSGSRSVFRRPC